MSDQNYPDYIYGLHEAGGQHLMIEAGRPGWVLELASIGLNPQDPGMPSGDYSHLANDNIGVIVRINNGYEPAGTLPTPDRYSDFARTCAAFVGRSTGCHIWIIGNEPNHEHEWPGGPSGQKIVPENYATAYRLCRNEIHRVPGHERDQVLVAGPAPWNALVKYPGNELGDWVKYFSDTLAFLQAGECDGFALHTYTHHLNLDQITGEFFHGAPGYQHLHNEFKTYRDFMQAIPTRFRELPVYITETDPTDPNTGWEDGRNIGWIQTAYRDIADWNRNPNNQPILALILYRWPETDQKQWTISTRHGIIEDFRQALRAEPAADYKVPLTRSTEPPIIEPPTNGGPTPSVFTNQDILTAFLKASTRLGYADQWDLMQKKTSLRYSDLKDRQALYTGKSLDEFPDLTEQERDAIRIELAAIVGPEEAMSFAVSFSAPDAAISFSAAEEEAAPISGFLRARTDLLEAPLDAPVELQIDQNQAKTGLENRVVQTWNRYGWWLMTVAEVLNLEPGIALATLATTVDRRGFAPDGRLLIHFENHIFFDKWGQEHIDIFQQHFRFDASQPWQSHQWRSNPAAAWQPCQPNQADQWALFEFAANLDETAAKLALAMGAPQIMGFNYPVIGHMSVDQMFADFAASENHQLVGFFDLIGGPTGNSRPLQALQRQDLDTFAVLQYGSQQAARQASRLRAALTAFEAVKPDL